MTSCFCAVKKSRERLFRARAVCEAYTSFPRGSMKSCGLQICSDRSGNVDAHPRGAFYVIGISYHIKFFGDVSQFCFLDRYKNIQTEILTHDIIITQQGDKREHKCYYIWHS